VAGLVPRVSNLFVRFVNIEISFASLHAPSFLKTRTCMYKPFSISCQEKFFGEEKFLAQQAANDYDDANVNGSCLRAI
jgi:hypothetical protein